MYSFSFLFLAYTILLGLRLDDWKEDEERGDCYKTHLVTNLSASHPLVDKVYLGITASWFLISMFAAVFSTRKTANAVLILALLQYPLHLYMAAAMRAANQDSLDSDDENNWDFGRK
jgi:hypothetical protein